MRLTSTGSRAKSSAASEMKTDTKLIFGISIRITNSEHGLKLIRRANLDVVAPSQSQQKPSKVLSKGSSKTVVSEHSCGYTACRKPGASLTCAWCKGVSCCSWACQKQH